MTANAAAIAAPAVDLLASVSTPGRWVFTSATEAGRAFLALLGVCDGGELGLYPEAGERFIASAKAAGLTLGLAPEPEPVTMPRIERAAVTVEVAR